MSNYQLTARELPLNTDYDVIVAGGGPAGCAAAIGAAQEGAKTLIIESAGVLGGMGTSGLVPWFCGYGDGERVIARGVAENVLHALEEETPHLRKKPYGAPAIDPETLKRIYDNLVTSSGADILFHSQVCSVDMKNDREIDTILVANKAGISAYRAKVYVDCTGDADLAYWAGAEYVKGDQNGEMQPATHCFAIGNVDEYALRTGAKVHYYDPDSPIHKAIKSDKYPLIWDLHSCLMQIGPGTFGFNMGHIYKVDNTDPASTTKALILGRQTVKQYRDALAEFHPAFANSYLIASGSYMGIRETRRIIGNYTLTGSDYLERRSFDDEICRNAYGIDVHCSEAEYRQLATRTIEELKEYNRKLTRPLKPGESFGVPYRCLTPKDLDNVLVAGRSISTDREANGSTRIMACCLNTGEAAGRAAAMSAQQQLSIHDIDTQDLRQRLKQHGAYLP